MPRPKFSKGNKFGKGGYRPGAGDKPKWWKEKAEKIIRTSAGLQMLEDAINGKPVDVFITQAGEEIPIQAKYKDRKDTFFELVDHVFGKPGMGIQLENGDKVNIVTIVQKAEEERGI